MKEVTKTYYVSEDCGYVITERPDGRFNWMWVEAGEDPDTDGTSYRTIADALYAAADDWEDAGSNFAFPTYASTLRKAAGQYNRR